MSCRATSAYETPPPTNIYRNETNIDEFTIAALHADSASLIAELIPRQSEEEK